jgi:peptidoglycan/xylan/chitin deacetylase (PgdA/CDA1 family)
MVLGAPLTYSLPKRTDRVALTFDDGPHPEYTPKVLRLLERFGIKATFFLIGDRAQKHSDLVRAIWNAGHEVGGHSQTHKPATELFTMKLVADEVNGCITTLKRITGRSPRFYRPPYGQVTFRLLLYCRSIGIKPILWSLDPWDYSDVQTMKPNEFIHSIKPGQIILMHDNRAKCPELLECSVGGLLDRGIAFATLGEVFLRAGVA